MPQSFRIDRYVVYFGSNENDPLEPIHVHIAIKNPTRNATKVWITRAGKCIVCNNDAQIPQRALKNIVDIIEARSQDIIDRWCEHFGEIKYYC